MPLYVILTIGSLPAALLGMMVLHAHRRRRRIVEPEERSVLDELDDLVELEAHARTVAAAADQAIAAANEAFHRTGHAVHALDLAGWHYRQVRRQARAAGHPLRLVERAAVNAYRSGQLSVAELNQVWRYTQTASVTGNRRDDLLAVDWDSRLHAARQRYEQAAIEVTDVYRKAQLTTIAARALAEEADVAESHLSAAQRSASTGLAALLLTGHVQPLAVDH